MSVWTIVGKARDSEGLFASLAVKAVQSGRDPSGYMRDSAHYRAERYEFAATGAILRPLLDERLAELRDRLGARQA